MIGFLQLRMSAGALLCLMISPGKAGACDELIGKIITSHLAPAIEVLDCSILGKAGIDKSDHKLTSVCYTSNGPNSTIEMTVRLSCHTSDRAVIKSQISENVSAEAHVSGANCNVQSVNVKPSGEIGKLLANAFNVNGRAHKALQDALNEVCKR